ncbi:chemotaxis protein CheA [Pelobacter propionicus]|uniref:histidine kinase n=1 Tax=Pelobacter propionicus (strain DSM 2379 / NBRC 103807 / OttBd1) TaxID=338966 RepID=A1AMD6_PELPD|nr:chemotaxis protein CheA [Pelobacter propionicus]ABK98506.1 CheA signal transduction histidine kinases [Pelobacter propionicus DSM 2379]
MSPIDCEDQELLEGFLSETAELLEKLDDDLVALEKSSDDADLLNRIFRSIHTVKGASSFLGFDLLVKVTHKTEDVLNRLRKGELQVTPEIMDVILEATDLVKVLVSDIKAGEIQEREIDGTIAKLLPLLVETVVDVQPQVEAPPSEPAESAVPSVAEAAAPAEPSPPQDAPSAPQQKLGGDVVMKKSPAPPKPAEGRGDDLSDNTTVRVDIKRLDDLMNQVGELVLERNRMIQINQNLQQEDFSKVDFNEEFGKLTKRMNFVTSELQMQVLKMRMLPVEKVFKKFPRIVRSMARDLGKEVDLHIFGEETELDRSVVDEIGDPLIHLIRNAMDHGLEMPEQRLASGKPRVGNLVLSAVHEGNQIIISIKDDGNGIDTDRVGRKALEKGLVTEEQLAAMSQREMFDLIFLPGFSTKDKANDLSGRGVGMDVVKTNIKKLNGLIEIKSEKGQGSEFILRLPLTLAIIQSLLVEVEGEVYSIPLSSVLETLRVDQRQFHIIGGQEVLKLRDMVLPLVRLERVFGVQRCGEPDDFCYIVVVGSADKRMGLVVTRLVGQQEVAIKSLGNYLANIPGIAGSTILGDGRVALIIDPVGLVENGECGSGR